MNPLKKMKLTTLRKKVKANIERREAGKSPELEAEVAALFELAEFYDDNRHDKDLPRAEFLSRETYRLAAVLGSNKAQYQCGQIFLDEGKFWTEMSDDIFILRHSGRICSCRVQRGFFLFRRRDECGPCVGDTFAWFGLYQWLGRRDRHRQRI